MDIKKVSFGADTAEADISLGLPKYFEPTEAYRSFSSGKKYLLVGNRGVGKSAIFKRMQSEDLPKGTGIIDVTPDKCSYEQFLASKDVASLGKATVGAFQAGWKFSLLVLLLKQIHAQSGTFKGGAFKDIHNYLRDNHANVKHDAITVLATYALRIVELLLKEAPLKLVGRAEELQKLYKLEELDFLMPAVKEAVKRKPVWIFVDELDKGWDNSDTAKLFVAGLLQAADDLNQISPNLRVVVSIRRDIVENLPQQMLDWEKWRRFVEEIRWNSEELKSMLIRRVKHFYKGLDHLGDDDVWGRIFEPTIFKKTHSFTYFLDRSMMRPREIIQFCQLCVEQHPSNSALIGYETAAKAEVLHSKNRLDDLSREYQSQYPQIRRIFESFNGKTIVWERGVLENHLIQLVLDHGDYFKDWVRAVDQKDLIEVLYSVGFIQAYVAGSVRAGRKHGSGYYAVYDLVSFDMDNIERFRIHPAFRFTLNLKEREGSAGEE